MIAILLCMVLFTSCNPYLINTMGYDVLNEDLDAVWLKTSGFEYSRHDEAYVKSPAEFEEDGFGDCEDFAIYMIYHLGPEASMVVVKNESVNHAIVEYKGLYIEPRNYGKLHNASELEILKIYSYEYIMRLATRWGTKTLN